VDVPRSTRLAAALVAFVAAAVYATRLAPSIVLEGDSTEIVSAAAVWGVPHAPGYPALTAFGHLLTKLPFGSIAWRLHLASGLFHTGAVYAVCLLTGRVTRSAAATAVAGASLALARAFFAGSLYAEVFPLNDLFFAVLLLVAYEAEAAHAEDEERARRLLYQGSCLFGLALAHHPMILLGAPALVVAARSPLRATLRRGAGAIGLLAASVVLPFAASYAIVPFVAARHPPISTGDVHDLASLTRLILRVDYGGPFHVALRDPDAVDLGARLSHWLGSLVRSSSVLPLAAAIGLVGYARKPATRPDALVFFLAVLLPGPLFAMLNAHCQRSDEFHVALVERFTTMALVGLAPAIGMAADLVMQRTTSWAPGRRAAAGLGLVVVTIVVLAPGLRGVDYSSDRRGLAYARDLLRSVPDRALVLVAGDVAGAAALYTCNVERACGDRIIVAPGLLSMPWYRAELARMHPGMTFPSSVYQIHELALAQVDVRQVFAMPGVVKRDPLLVDELEATPALLLLRLTRKADRDDARASALLWAEAMTDDTARCAGCRLDASTIIHPAEVSGLPAEYAVAMKNHAVVARELGKSELAARLDARADALVRISSP
jgi:hypothetical protein